MVDIMLTGDSFTAGYSVHADENIAALLRSSGFSTINVGKAGSNGPLIELAVLKEYAEPLEPKIVLWLYYVYDIDDLELEITFGMMVLFRKIYIRRKSYVKTINPI